MKKKETDKVPSKRKNSKSLKDRVNQHLKDKNDVITDEDMRNIKVGEDIPAEEEKSAEDLAEAVKEKKATSPWTILTEEDK